MDTSILQELDEINENLQNESYHTPEKLNSLNEKRKKLLKSLNDDLKKNKNVFNEHWNIAQKSVYHKNKLAIAN